MAARRMGFWGLNKEFGRKKRERGNPKADLVSAILKMLREKYEANAVIIQCRRARGPTARPTPDIVGAFRGGRWFSMNIETGHAPHGKAMAEMLARLGDYGCFHANVRSVEEAEDVMAGWMRLVSRAGSGSLSSPERAARPASPRGRL